MGASCVKEDIPSITRAPVHKKGNDRKVMTGNDTQRRYAGINKAYDTFTDILYKDSRMLCGQGWGV